MDRNSLPRRTLRPSQKAAQMVGLRSKQTEAHVVRGATKSELCEALPRYSWNQIIGQVQGRKFLRPKKPPVNTGHPVIDQIRQRARYLNLTMSDVDAMSGTKRYFNAAGWTKKRRPNLTAVAKAILALDDEVTAIWQLTPSGLQFCPQRGPPSGGLSVHRSFEPTSPASHRVKLTRYPQFRLHPQPSPSSPRSRPANRRIFPAQPARARLAYQ
jgi:hypothetical protein